MDYIVKMYKDWKFQSQFHEIVSDMDDECFFSSEKQSIRDSGRSLKKYGSTCNHVRNSNGDPQLLVRHELAKTDTLQGIALKYGCTTEQIRRTNRLFAQDSLFLRQHLMIPVDKESPHCPGSSGGSTSSSNLSSSSSSENAAARPQTLAVIEDDGGVDATDGASAAHKSVLSPEEESRKDIDAFLGKIDSTLAQTRKFVAKSQHSFDSSRFDGTLSPNGPLAGASTSGAHCHDAHSSNPYQQPQHYQSYQQSSQPNRHQHRHSSGSNATASATNNNNGDSIELITMTTQSRRVQNSLQRLEQQQDDFFKL